MIKVFEYSACSTCKQALKFLETTGVPYQRVAIVDQPPGTQDLKRMLGYLEAQGGSLKNLFNTSGVQYREMKIADKLAAGMKLDEALKLLAQNGKLVKRPFLLTESDGTVGFNAEKWTRLLKGSK